MDIFPRHRSEDPEDKWILGQAFCAKILKMNGQCVHRSTYQHLTPSEIEDPSEIQKRKEFDASIESKLGPNTKPEHFAHDKDIETPTYDQMDGQIHHAKKADDEESPITFDQYVNAEVMLPKGDQIITGTVKEEEEEG